MQAGALKHRAWIERPIETRDVAGGIARSWTVEATRWCSVEPIRGRELYEAQQAQMRVDVRVRMRFYAGLTTSHRITILDGSGRPGHTYEISAVLNPELGDAELELLCVEAEAKDLVMASSSSSSSSLSSSSSSSSSSSP